MTRILSWFSFMALMILVFPLAGQDYPYRENIDFKFDRADFNGEFCVYTHSDGPSDFYVTDLEKLPGRFERIYFLNLVYRERMVVSIDDGIDKDLLWFKSFEIYPRKDVTGLLNDLYLKSAEAARAFSDAEKSDWLRVHDKFSQK